jgi:hypothetical protein
MTETDISKVLIEGEYATIMGVKYKRVESPKSIRAEEIWEAFKGELIDNGLKDSEDVRQGLSTAIREVANRLCTDVGEMKCYIDVVRKIADELDELDT